MIFIPHQKLANLGRLLGYANYEEGLCFGFINMWAQAVLVNEVAVLEERLRLINKASADNFSSLLDAINKVRQKQGKNLTEADRKLIDLLAFYEGIYLYQNSRYITALFGTLTKQRHLSTIYSFAKSSLLKKAPFSIPLSRPYVFTKEKSLAFFSKLAWHLAKADRIIPVTVVCDGHAVGFHLVSNAPDRWRYMDASGLFVPESSEAQAKTITTEELIDIIFRDLAHDPDYAAINLRVLTHSNDKFDQKLKDFSTKYMIEAADVDGKDKFIFSKICRFSHIETINHLIALGVDINQTDANGNTALSDACHNNNAGVVQLLIQNGADVFKVNALGQTAFDFAPPRDQSPIFSMLEAAKMRQQAIKNLSFALKDLDLYAKKHSSIQKGIDAKNLYEELSQLLDAWMLNKKIYKSDCKKLIQECGQKISDANLKANFYEHRAYYKVILGNLALALTGLGAIAVGIQLTYSYFAKGNAVAFFNTTQSGQRIDAVMDSCSQLKSNL